MEMSNMCDVFGNGKLLELVRVCKTCSRYVDNGDLFDDECESCHLVERMQLLIVSRKDAFVNSIKFFPNFAPLMRKCLEIMPGTGEYEKMLTNRMQELEERVMKSVLNVKSDVNELTSQLIPAPTQASFSDRTNGVLTNRGLNMQQLVNNAVREDDWRFHGAFGAPNASMNASPASELNSQDSNEFVSVIPNHTFSNQSTSPFLSTPIDGGMSSSRLNRLWSQPDIPVSVPPLLPNFCDTTERSSTPMEAFRSNALESLFNCAPIGLGSLGIPNAEYVGIRKFGEKQQCNEDFDRRYGLIPGGEMKNVWGVQEQQQQSLEAGRPVGSQVDLAGSYSLRVGDAELGDSKYIDIGCKANRRNRIRNSLVPSSPEPNAFEKGTSSIKPCISYSQAVANNCAKIVQPDKSEPRAVANGVAPKSDRTVRKAKLPLITAPSRRAKCLSEQSLTMFSSVQSPHVAQLKNNGITYAYQLFGQFLLNRRSEKLFCAWYSKAVKCNETYARLVFNQLRNSSKELPKFDNSIFQVSKMSWLCLKKNEIYSCDEILGKFLVLRKDRSAFIAWFMQKGGGSRNSAVDVAGCVNKWVSRNC